MTPYRGDIPRGAQTASAPTASEIYIQVGPGPIADAGEVTDKQTEQFRGDFTGARYS